MEKSVSLNVDQEIVKSIVKKEIEAAIVAQFNKTPDMIHHVVSAALAQKVTANGTVSSYASDNRNDIIEVLSRKAIMGLAKEAITEFVKEKKDEIKKALVKEMQKPKTARVMANALSRGLVEQIEGKWNFNCYVKFHDKRD